MVTIVISNFKFNNLYDDGLSNKVTTTQAANIKVYVNNSGQLVSRSYTGADTVLNFSSDSFPIGTYIINGTDINDSSKFTTLSGTIVSGTGIKINASGSYGGCIVANIKGKNGTITSTADIRHIMNYANGTYSDKISSTTRSYNFTNKGCEIVSIWVYTSQNNTVTFTFT